MMGLFWQIKHEPSLASGLRARQCIIRIVSVIHVIFVLRARLTTNTVTINKRINARMSLIKTDLFSAV